MAGSTKRGFRDLTLRHLLLGFVGILILILLLGSFMVNVSSARDYIQKQLLSHAQDTATSLGLSLSTVIDAQDTVAASSMIDAIFDNGYYERIIFRDIEGNPVIVRENELTLEGVPAWFVDMIPLVAPTARSEIMSGWTQLGYLEVRSHPGYAYRDLWGILTNEIAWFAIVAVVALMTLGVFVGIVLRPLSRIEDQARAIRNRDFSVRSPEPGTRELRRVAKAMNSMSERLGQMFGEQLSLIEHLRQQSFRDGLTGLGNRAEFDKRLNAELVAQEKVTSGSLLLLQIGGFAQFNTEFGREAGDALLKEVATELTEAIKPIAGSFAARRAGADFSIYLPGIADERADSFADAVLKKLTELPSIKDRCRNDVLHIGIACVDETKTMTNLLSESDLALRRAQAKGPNGWQRYVVDSVMPERTVRQANEWLQILRDTINQQSVVLHYQPVLDVSGEKLLHKRIMSRIDVAGELVTAGVFIPMAERFGLLAEFDRMVIEKAIQEVEEKTPAEPLCIDLSSQSVADEEFIEWILSRLASASTAARHLVFELSEYCLKLAEPSVNKLSQKSRSLGFGLSIDRFGVAAVPFAYLQHVVIDYLKVDHSFIRDVQENRDNQFFLRSVLQIAHGQDIAVIAVGVETEEEWQLLQQLGIDGGMGYHLGKPGPG